MISQHTNQPTLLTLHDAITDSPVYRTNVHHYDEQLDHLEKWLDSLSRHLKLYTEKINKLNLETDIVCQRVVPVGIESALIDPDVTMPILKSFANALKAGLSFKSKLVSDLEENLVQPLQQFLKTHLKDFKSFRKQHEKALEQYEIQLSRYSTQGKNKEPSALREEAFRLYEARKAYIHMSGEHVVRIIKFRSLLEHCLVERFSAATTAHKEYDVDRQLWDNLDTMLVSWRQWLVDDKRTCIYQLKKHELAREKLEMEYLCEVEPCRQLESYGDSEVAQEKHVPLATQATQASSLNEDHQSGSKWGYLFLRNSSTWTRKWFFLHDGYIGFCSTSIKSKDINTVILEERIPVLMCTINPLKDTDRRFCFEISCQKATYIAQAETKKDMEGWIDALETSRSFIVRRNSIPPRRASSNGSHRSLTSQSDSDSTRSRSLGVVSAKSRSTTEVTTPIDVPAILSTSPTSPLSNLPGFAHIQGIQSISPFNNILKNTRKSSLDRMITSNVSLVMLSTSHEFEAISLSESISLTPLLVWGAASSQIRAACSLNNNLLPLWGIPWTIAFMNVQFLSNTDTSLASPSKMLTEKEVIWPIRPTDAPEPIKVSIPGYPPHLEVHNKGLRSLFGGVTDSEVVLDVFICSLRKKPTENDFKSSTSPTSPVMDSLLSQITTAYQSSSAELGFAYTGRAFITQDTFWFYSTMLMTCIHTVAVRLQDIKEVRVIKDLVLSSEEDYQNGLSCCALVIELMDETKGPVTFSSVMYDINILADKLRFMISNAKSKSTDLNKVYQEIQRMSDTKSSKSLQDQMVSSDFSSYNIFGAEIPTMNLSVTPSESKSRAENIRNGINTLRNKQSEAKETARTLTKKVLKRDRSTKTPNTLIIETKKPVAAPVDPDALPLSIKAPTSPCSCDCPDHLERLESECELPISAKRLFELMFSDKANASPTDGGVWKAKNESVDGHDLTVTNWEQEDGKMTRTLKYIMPVTNPIVRLKEAEVVENQVIVKQDPYLRYVVQISTKTAALPYADAFIPSVRYCITWVGPSKCKLACYMGVAWVKSVMIRSVITRAALKAMGESVCLFVEILQDEADKVAARVEEERRLIFNGHNVSERVENGNDIVDDQPLEDYAENDDRKDLTDLSYTSGLSKTQFHTNYTDDEEGEDTLRKSAENRQLDDSSRVNSNSVTSSSCLSPASPTSQQHSILNSGHTAEKQKIKSATSLRRKAKKDEFTAGWGSKVPLFTMVTVVSAILLLWVGFGRSSVNLQPENMNIGSNNSIATNSVIDRVVSRAVYLKDLETGVLENHILPPYSKAESFQAFLKQRRTDDISTVQHQWFSGKNYKMAIELDSSRERIAIMRHDLLTIFRMLNKVDTQLLENEYMNWLKDNRQKCKEYSSNVYDLVQCDRIDAQLLTFNE
ncbi:hypothetical protein CLU79DRAFT_833800 [Phycomyces nitens]|nr:hypothetical protein CLU79DRAFT_833800 [Phycomyces nitens]